MGSLDILLLSMILGWISLSNLVLILEFCVSVLPSVVLMRVGKLKLFKAAARLRSASEGQVPFDIADSTFVPCLCGRCGKRQGPIPMKGGLNWRVPKKGKNECQ